MFEIGKFSQFIVGDKCDGLLPLIRRFLDKEVHGDDVCFDVKLDVAPAGYGLSVCAFVMFVAASAFLFVCHSALTTLRLQLHVSPLQPQASGSGHAPDEPVQPPDSPLAPPTP